MRKNALPNSALLLAKSIMKLIMQIYAYYINNTHNYVCVVNYLILLSKSHCPIAHFYAAVAVFLSDRAFLRNGQCILSAWIEGKSQRIQRATLGQFVANLGANLGVLPR